MPRTAAGSDRSSPGTASQPSEASGPLCPRAARGPRPAPGPSAAPPAGAAPCAAAAASVRGGHAVSVRGSVRAPLGSSPSLGSPLHPSQHPSAYPCIPPRTAPPLSAPLRPPHHRRAVPARSCPGGRVSSAAWWKVGPAGPHGAGASPGRCRGFPGLPGGRCGREGPLEAELATARIPGTGEAAPALHSTLRPRAWNRQPPVKVPSSLTEHGCAPRSPSAAPSQHHGVAQGCPALAPAHCSGSFSSLGTGPKPWGVLLLPPCLQHSAAPGAVQGELLLWQFRVALPPPSAAVPACSSASLQLGEAWHLLVRSISSFPDSTSSHCSPLPAALPRAKTPPINTNRIKCRNGEADSKEE